MHKLFISYKAEEGQNVSVKNYRKKPAQWETGTVNHVEAKIRKAGQYWVQYQVMLDRTTPTGKYIFITVGSEDIVPIGD